MTARVFPVSKSETRLIGLSVLLTAMLLPLLLWIPQRVPGDPTVLSAALREGYNTVVAYRVAILWCIATVPPPRRTASARIPPFSRKHSASGSKRGVVQ